MLPRDPSEPPRTSFIYVGSMAVSKRHRRKGYAAAMLQASEELARLWEHDEVYLEVQQGNAAAKELYRSRGFHVISTAKGGLFMAEAKRKQLMAKRIPLESGDL